ncbi:MAG: ThiS family protein [Candidatus Fischerbacteria bacterium RBG_13_37_8]|uniref:ThiS family protein n=1 Tax=Candidatus Fischerbacteria bacterium RBG_13_37_8 TaxID=1817863 RepID=A0A1F5V5V5_9BACT|nr:MAG: ThiS family protein [Candidatus Fischerbacteria bacterium RBG_13_37_8]
MSVKVHIHRTFRHITNNLAIVEVKGETVGECLKDLIRQFPGLKIKLFKRNDKLHNHIEIYINNESAFPYELSKQVKDGDEITPILMISGG